MAGQSRSPAERQLAEWGLDIEEMEFPAEVDSGIDAYAQIYRNGDEFDVTLRVRSGSSRDARREFADWAVSRIRRFAEHGPEPDGWQLRSDGGWQLWVRSVYLGDLDE
jgi:hypothetical protein